MRVVQYYSNHRFVISCSIDVLQKFSEIIENIFSLIFVLRKIWYFHHLRKIKKIWYLGRAFLRKFCFLCSARPVLTLQVKLKFVHECKCFSTITEEGTDMSNKKSQRILSKNRGSRPASFWRFHRFLRVGKHQKRHDCMCI